MIFTKIFATALIISFAGACATVILEKEGEGRKDTPYIRALPYVGLSCVLVAAASFFIVLISLVWEL